MNETQIQMSVPTEGSKPSVEFLQTRLNEMDDKLRETNNVRTHLLITGLNAKERIEQLELELRRTAKALHHACSHVALGHAGEQPPDEMSSIDYWLSAFQESADAELALEEAVNETPSEPAPQHTETGNGDLDQASQFAN